MPAITITIQVGAQQDTIQMTNEQGDRLIAGWESRFGISPTIPIFKQHLIREFKAIVNEGERRANEEAFSPDPFEPT